MSNDEQAIHGRPMFNNAITDFKIFNTLKCGWQQIHGTKLLLLIGLFLLFAIGIGQSYVDKLFMHFPHYKLAIFSFDKFLRVFIFYPLFFGLLLIGVRQALGAAFNIKTLFAFFCCRNLISVVTLVLWAVLIFGWPFLLLALAEIIYFHVTSFNEFLYINSMIYTSLKYGISLPHSIKIGIYSFFSVYIFYYLYFLVAYMLAVPLIAEKKLPSGAALTLSRKIVNHHWLRVFGLMIIKFLLIIVPSILIIIGVLLMPGASSELYPFMLAYLPEFMVNHIFIFGCVIFFIGLLVYLMMCLWFINAYGVMYQRLVNK